MNTPVFLLVSLMSGLSLGSQCPSVTLEEHCSRLNRVIQEDPLNPDCGAECPEDKEPGPDMKTCVYKHCKSLPNHGLTDDKECLPCPDGMTGTEDGLSCQGQYSVLSLSR